MKPYYQDEMTTLYLGDCREILPNLELETLITDPVWPNSTALIPGRDHPARLFKEMIKSLPAGTKRLVIHLGVDTDPRFLKAIPSSWPFLRVVWLRYAKPSYKGRLLLSSDVAYAFGKWPDYIKGRQVIGGEVTSTRADKLFMRHDGRHKNKVMNRGDIVDSLPHPCARRLEHVEFLVRQLSDREICDPFLGSGTTGVAAKKHGRKFIGIEIEEKYLELAINRIKTQPLAVQEQLITAEQISYPRINT